MHFAVAQDIHYVRYGMNISWRMDIFRLISECYPIMRIHSDIIYSLGTSIRAVAANEWNEQFILSESFSHPTRKGTEMLDDIPLFIR